MTDWLPVNHIPIDMFREKCGLKKIKEEENREIYYDGKSYIHVIKTKIGGIQLIQYGANQQHYDIIENLGKIFNTKFISYIGEPYDGHNYNYSDLNMREWGF